MTAPRPPHLGELVRRKKRAGFKGTVYGVKGDRVLVRWWQDPCGREVDRDMWHDRDELAILPGDRR